MLNGISPLLGPDLLATLCRMGHGDEIVFADAHFPGESLGPQVHRADGLMIPALLDAVLPLFPLDPYVELIDREKGLRIIREWNPDIWQLLPVSLRPDRGGNGSVIGFLAGEQKHLFDDFAKAPMVVNDTYGLDQVYITREANKRRYWPDGWNASFRRSCVPHWPLNLMFKGIPKPKAGKIVVFHGIPNPTDLTADGTYRWGTKWRFGFGPVDWVQSYWRKYSRGSSSENKAA